MTSQINLQQQLLTDSRKESTDLTQIMNQIEEHCHNCKPLSPMSCFEQCEIWKMKNEFLNISKILGQGDHLSGLFNVIKNTRRLKILEIVSSLPCDIRELQKRLKDNGYYHSCRTIMEYFEPMMRIGLVRKEGSRYQATLYGRKVNDMLKGFRSEDALPVHSGCYEELVLRELLHSPKTYEELAKSVPSLSRVMKRLHEEGLITRKQSFIHVFYFKTNRNFNGKLSPTEKRILDVIPETGASAQKISRLVKINLRRTYKYLRRLRKKQMVLTKDRPKTYRLTSSGREVARFLDGLARFISIAQNLSIANGKAN